MEEEFVYISHIFDFHSHAKEVLNLIEECPHKLFPALQFYTKRNNYFVIREILEKYGALKDCIEVIVKNVSPKSYRIISLITQYMMDDMLIDINVYNRILHYFRLLNKLQEAKNVNYWILKNIVSNSNLTNEEFNILDLILDNNIGNNKKNIFPILEILYYRILYSSLDNNTKYNLLNQIVKKDKYFYLNPKYKFQKIKNEYENCNKQQVYGVIALMVSTGIFMYFTKSG